MNSYAYTAMRIDNSAPSESQREEIAFCEICAKATNSLTAIPDAHAEPMLACVTCTLKSFETTECKACGDPVDEALIWCRECDWRADR